MKEIDETDLLEFLGVLPEKPSTPEERDEDEFFASEVYRIETPSLAITLECSKLYRDVHLSLCVDGSVICGIELVNASLHLQNWSPTKPSSLIITDGRMTITLDKSPWRVKVNNQGPRPLA